MKTDGSCMHSRLPQSLTMTSDKYELGPRIGKGNFGAVFEATHAVFGTPAAIKLIQVGRLSDPDQVLDEARILASLPEHPHVVSVHDAGMWSGSEVYIAMELCSGGSLDSLCKQSPLDPATACHYVAEACSGLDHIHQRNLLHLDIRPANILLGSDGKAKLVDFGLAKWLADPAVDDWYTPHAAPEFVESGEASHASDIYAAGMTLAHLLTGGEICKGVPSGADFLTDCADGRWPNLDLVEPNTPARLRRVLRDATQYNEAKRPAAARDLKRSIDKATPINSFTSDGDGDWSSTDGAWAIRTTRHRKGATVDVLRNGRRVKDLQATGLSDDDARKQVARVLGALSYDKVP
jgi:eukaryotic-like serine/threonine-protein kinase